MMIGDGDGEGYRNLLKRYARYAPNYDRRFARYSAGTLSHALGMIPDHWPGALLDVACGTGLFEVLLRRHRPLLRVTGVDISPQMLEKARQRFAQTKKVSDTIYQWLVGTAEHLPVANGAFDIITCNNAFHLVQNAPAALREFRRALRPNGMVVIVDWCLDYPQMHMVGAVGRMSDHQPRHIRHLREMIDLLKDAGLRVRHRERFLVPPWWGLMCVVASKPVEVEHPFDDSRGDDRARLEPSLGGARS